MEYSYNISAIRRLQWDVFGKRTFYLTTLYQELMD